jgi:hypothetical protein
MSKIDTSTNARFMPALIVLSAFVASSPLLSMTGPRSAGA